MTTVQTNTRPWSDCSVLITGGNGEIGQALVAQLRALGATVYITSRNAGDDFTLPWDMADAESTAQLNRTIKQRQLAFDILIHCAHQFSPARLIPQVSAAELQQSLTTNLVPVYELMRAQVRSMYRRQFGRVLLLGSFISVCGGTGKIPYIIEKSAFNGFAKGFNAEFEAQGVVTSVLHPAIVDTAGIHERVPDAILQQMQAASADNTLLSIDAVVQACLPLIDPTRAISGGIEHLSGGVVV